MKKQTLLAIATTLAIPALSLAFDPMAATIKISGANTYDYVIVGESPKATDGFDNPYDTFAPGGSMNQTYISAYFNHPEWNQVKSQFRGDIRSLAKSQTWTMNLKNTIPTGTQTTIAVEKMLSILPASVELTLLDNATGATTNLKTGSYTFASTAADRTFTITATQPETGATTPSPNPTPANSMADGDVDGGGAGISDAIKVLRMAVHLDAVTPQALTHGDMDGDGALTVRDALLIIRKVVGLD